MSAVIGAVWRVGEPMSRGRNRFRQRLFLFVFYNEYSDVRKIDHFPGSSQKRKCRIQPEVEFLEFAERPISQFVLHLSL
jgi:hypothetical protein